MKTAMTGNEELSRRSLLTGLAGVSLAANAIGQLPAKSSAEPYRLGVMAGMYATLPLEDAMTRIRKAGYKYVSMARKHGEEIVFDPSLTKAQCASVIRRMKDCGVQPFLSLGGFGGADPSTEAGLQKYIAQLDLCATFEIPIMIGGGPWYYTKFPNIPKADAIWKPEVGQFEAGFEKALRHAEQIRVTLALKPHTGISARGKDCLTLLKQFPSPYFRIAWDAGNVSFYEGVYPDPDFPALASQVCGVCLKDHLGLRGDENFPIPGQGQIDHESMFRTLFKAGFHGPLAIERMDGRDGFGNKARPEVVDGRLAAAYTYLAPLLDRVTAHVAS